ncbi:MAG TPA: glycosyltransferase family 2 protein [Polyangiaceae bacterium]|nr:glycosyltransferase family 2 protein [Polyangiaceae bacterium]
MEKSTTFSSSALIDRPVEVKLGAMPASPPSDLEVSIVMPCLNEARTLGPCVEAAVRCIRENNLAGEVIVADNGSTDGSQEIARQAGARVVSISQKGYGAALMGGFAAARGRYLIMGDSDQSYDFAESVKFVEKLRQGYDLVMGNRFDVAGGGGVQPGAMPLKNRYLGNPVLTYIGRTLFSCPAHDFHCGLRGFTKTAFDSMQVRTPGMEFASEIVIKATLRGMKITEVPIKLHKDGRDRPPHLRPWRDGWRHLRFMLCLSPRWTLFAPGAALLLIGLVLGSLVAVGPFMIGRVGLDVHTLVVASLAVLVGYSWITAALAMRVFALAPEIGDSTDWLSSRVRAMTFERGLLLAIALCLIGVVPLLWVTIEWARAGFGPLDVHTTIRPMIIGATIVALGVQTGLMSVICAMFRMHRDFSAPRDGEGR